MGDFLGRLAERALGQIAVARPVLAPVYAPGQQAAASGEGALWPEPALAAPEAAAAPAGAAGSLRRPAPDPGAPAHAEPDRLPPPAGSGPVAPAGQKPGPPAAALPLPRAAAFAAGEPQPLTPAPVRPTGAPPQSLPQPQHWDPQPLLPAPAGLTPPRLLAGATTPAAGEPLPYSAGARNTAPPAPMGRRPPAGAALAPLAPTIAVSIGRVEVRAISTAPAAPRAGAAPPVMTLQQYLQERRKGEGR